MNSTNQFYSGVFDELKIQLTAAQKIEDDLKADMDSHIGKYCSIVHCI